LVIIIYTVNSFRSILIIDKSILQGQGWAFSGSLQKGLAHGAFMWRDSAFPKYFLKPKVYFNYFKCAAIRISAFFLMKGKTS